MTIAFVVDGFLSPNYCKKQKVSLNIKFLFESQEKLRQW